MTYRRTIGRLTVEVNDNGGKMHDYGHGCTVSCVAGWNDSCPIVSHTVSVEELRDLRYLLDRAIAAADAAKFPAYVVGAFGEQAASASKEG